MIITLSAYEAQPPLGAALEPSPIDESARLLFTLSAYDEAQKRPWNQVQLTRLLLRKEAALEPSPIDESAARMVESITP